MTFYLLQLFGRFYSIPLLLLVWQASVSSGLAQSRLLPGLDEVAQALIADVSDGSLVRHTAITLGRAITGYGTAALLGIVLAALMARSVRIRNLVEPIFTFGYPIPKVALFPVFTYVFGIGTPSKIAFTTLECLYPIVIASLLGFRSVASRLIWTARNFGASQTTIFRRVILPAALPSVFSGLRIALPVSLIVVILTEMIGDSVGLGYFINVWSTRFNFAHVYGAILVIATCGFILDGLLMALRRHVMSWEPN
jgi:NitT/TauT family transport system permease protein